LIPIINNLCRKYTWKYFKSICILLIQIFNIRAGTNTDKYNQDANTADSRRTCISTSEGIQVNLDIRVFDQCGFRLIRSQTFIPFLYMCTLKFRKVRPIMKQKIFNTKIVARKQCCQIVLLPGHYAAISSVSLRPSSKAHVSKQCLPITTFHPK
jgi:hypothetical protein